jgi:hypothetical protein
MTATTTNQFSPSQLYLERIKVENKNWKNKVQKMKKTQGKSTFQLFQPAVTSRFDSASHDAYPHCDGGPMQRFFASPPPLPTDPTVRSLSELALRWCLSTVTGVSALTPLKPGPKPHAAAITSPHCRSFTWSGKTHHGLAPESTTDQAPLGNHRCLAVIHQIVNSRREKTTKFLLGRSITTFATFQEETC